MKTKKFIAYVLISLFVFSPFLNIESWASLPRTVPIMRPVEAEAGIIVCKWYCQWVMNQYCCQKYCCDCNGALCSITDYVCVTWPSTQEK
jgi:hypothetical protein